MMRHQLNLSIPFLTLGDCQYLFNDFRRFAQNHRNCKFCRLRPACRGALSMVYGGWNIAAMTAVRFAPRTKARLCVAEPRVDLQISRALVPAGPRPVWSAWRAPAGPPTARRPRPMLTVMQPARSPSLAVASLRISRNCARPSWSKVG